MKKGQFSQAQIVAILQQAEKTIQALWTYVESIDSELRGVASRYAIAIKEARRPYEHYTQGLHRRVQT